MRFVAVWDAERERWITVDRLMRSVAHTNADGVVSKWWMAEVAKWQNVRANEYPVRDRAEQWRELLVGARR